MKILLGFEKSKNPNKKYDAYVKNGNRIFKVSFGANGYEQYHDKIGRRLYKIRHEGDRHVKWSPGWFADQYLW